MTTFTLTINCDGAAFGKTDFDRAGEIYDCLEKIRFGGPACAGDNDIIRDSNGKIVGEWRITAD